MFRNCFYLLVALIMGCSQGGETGKKLSPADSLNAAITSLDKEIGTQSNDPVLYARRAELLLADRQPEKALGDLNRAVSLDNRNPSLYILLSDIYLIMGQPQNSGDALEKAISIQPENKEALLKKAKLNLILKNYRKTFETLSNLLALDSYNPPAYFLRAVTLLEYGDTSAAIADLMKAVDQDQGYYDAFFQLGELYSLKKDPLAESYLKNALNVRPQSREALYMLGMFYQETGLYDKAIAVYQNLATIDSMLATAPYNIGYIYLVYLHDFPKAVDFFTRSIRCDSSYYEAWYNRGYCQELLGNYKEAEKDYRKALRIEVNYNKAIEGLNRIDNQKVRK